jgi:hypothetical protein
MFGIGQAFSWIADELSRQYSLGYYPRVAGNSGQRRAIKVRVNDAELVVKSRDSYIYTGKKTEADETSVKKPAEKKPYVIERRQ